MDCIAFLYDAAKATHNCSHVGGLKASKACWWHLDRCCKCWFGLLRPLAALQSNRSGCAGPVHVGPPEPAAWNFFWRFVRFRLGGSTPLKHHGPTHTAHATHSTHTADRPNRPTSLSGKAQTTTVQKCHLVYSVESSRTEYRSVWPHRAGTGYRYRSGTGAVTGHRRPEPITDTASSLHASTPPLNLLTVY